MLLLVFVILVVLIDFGVATLLFGWFVYGFVVKLFGYCVWLFLLVVTVDLFDLGSWCVDCFIVVC